jgi:hypothetical protein
MGEVSFYWQKTIFQQLSKVYLLVGKALIWWHYTSSPLISSPVISSPHTFRPRSFRPGPFVPSHFVSWSFCPIELNLQNFMPRERPLQNVKFHIHTLQQLVFLIPFVYFGFVFLISCMKEACYRVRIRLVFFGIGDHQICCMEIKSEELGILA